MADNPVMRIFDEWKNGFPVNLETTQLNANTINVSWQERFQKDTEGQKIKGPIGYSAAALLVASIILPIMAGSWLLFLILFIAALILAVIGMKLQPLQKAVTFDPEHIQFDDHMIPTATVTRISIGERGEWVSLTEKEKESPLKIQIQLWINENNMIEISRNSFSKLTNLQIRNALDEALQNVRQTAVKDEQEETQGKTGDFGVPEY